MSGHNEVSGNEWTCEWICGASGAIQIVLFCPLDSAGHHNTTLHFNHVPTLLLLLTTALQPSSVPHFGVHTCELLPVSTIATRNGPSSYPFALSAASRKRGPLLTSSEMKLKIHSWKSVAKWSWQIDSECCSICQHSFDGCWSAARSTTTVAPSH